MLGTIRSSLLLATLLTVFAGAAKAQVPVLDAANLTKAQEIATSTQQILTADQKSSLPRNRRCRRSPAIVRQWPRAVSPRWRSAAVSRWRRRPRSAR
jgi:hypothetical protein